MTTKTIEARMTYLGHKYITHRVCFRRKTTEKALSEATEWMKTHSKTFVCFQFQTGEFMTGCYVARHSDAGNVGGSHYNGGCTIQPAGKSWTSRLYTRRCIS